MTMMSYFSKKKLHTKELFPIPVPLPVHSIHDNYKLISLLGSGSFGQVILAKSDCDTAHLTDNWPRVQNTLLEPCPESRFNKTPLVAIKILNKEQTNIRDHLKEKEIRFILSVPSHSNLVQIFDIFVDPLSCKINIVMESLNKSLFQLMTARKSTRFSHKTLKSILSQILNGLKHIHKHNFLHRDIKPENILVIPTSQFYGNKANIPPSRANDNYMVKIADFGLSRPVGCKESYTSYIATRWYRAPEILLRRDFQGCAVDIWAFGLVAVELINFSPLFPGASEFDQLGKIFRVLGCPLLPDVRYITPQTHYFIPLGGFWKETQHLGAKLGIHFPYEEGQSIHEVFDTKLYEGSGLEEVIKACLVWDPDSRADAATLSSFNYFKNTCTYEPKMGSIHNFNRSNFVRQLNTISWKHDQGSKETAKENRYIYTDFDDGYENQFMNHDPYTLFRKASFDSITCNDDENVVADVDVDLEHDLHRSDTNEEATETESYNSDVHNHLINRDLIQNDNEYSWGTQEPQTVKDYEALTEDLYDNPVDNRVQNFPVMW